MKTIRQIWLLALFAAISVKGFAADSSSTALQAILSGVLERAKVEDDNDRAFKQTYMFTREKVVEKYNGDGALLSRNIKSGTHRVRGVDPDQTPADETPDKKVVTGTPRNPHPAPQAQSFNKNQLINADFTNRFDFKLVGQEILDGRNMYVIDFAPADKILPENQIQDRVINKAAGRVWVDTNEFAIAKADLHLTKPVEAGFGILGALWKGTFTFDRARTDDGYWFTRNSSWHAEGRLTLFERYETHSETITNLVKTNAVKVNAVAAR